MRLACAGASGRRVCTKSSTAASHWVDKTNGFVLDQMCALVAASGRRSRSVFAQRLFSRLSRPGRPSCLPLSIRNVRLLAICITRQIARVGMCGCTLCAWLAR